MAFSIFLYLLVLLVSMLLTYWSKKNKTEIGNYIAYTIIFLLIALRYDIGYDYSGYVYKINILANEFNMPNVKFGIERYTEPFFTFLTYLLKDFNNAYIHVIAIHALIWTIFIYKTFKYYSIHMLGILLVFIIGFVFVEMDQMRQGTAIAVFLFSTRYIKERKFYRYLMFILFAASIHFSAIFLIVFYFAGYYKPNKLIYAITIILFYVFFNANQSIQLYEHLVTNYFPRYTLYNYETSTALEQFTSIGYRIRTAFYCIVWIFIIYKLPDNENTLANLLFVGALVFIIASGAMNIRRMSNFFTFTTVISIPLIYQLKKYRYILLLLVFGLFVFFIRDMIVGLHQGCIPYKLILTQDFLYYK